MEVQKLRSNAHERHEILLAGAGVDYTTTVFVVASLMKRRWARREGLLHILILCCQLQAVQEGERQVP